MSNYYPLHIAGESIQLPVSNRLYWRPRWLQFSSLAETHLILNFPENGWSRGKLLLKNVAHEKCHRAWEKLLAWWAEPTVGGQVSMCTIKEMISWKASTHAASEGEFFPVTTWKCVTWGYCLVRETANAWRLPNTIGQCIPPALIIKELGCRQWMLSYLFTNPEVLTHFPYFLPRIFIENKTAVVPHPQKHTLLDKFPAAETLGMRGGSTGAQILSYASFNLTPWLKTAEYAFLKWTLTPQTPLNVKVDSTVLTQFWVRK